MAMTVSGMLSAVLSLRDLLEIPEIDTGTLQALALLWACPALRLRHDAIFPSPPPGEEHPQTGLAGYLAMLGGKLQLGSRPADGQLTRDALVGQELDQLDRLGPMDSQAVKHGPPQSLPWAVAMPCGSPDRGAPQRPQTNLPPRSSTWYSGGCGHLAGSGFLAANLRTTARSRAHDRRPPPARHISNATQAAVDDAKIVAIEIALALPAQDVQPIEERDDLCDDIARPFGHGTP